MFNKFFNNLINSVNGLKFVLKEHSFIAEVLGGVILIPYILHSDLNLIFKLIIIGDSAVGKSCLLHRLTNNEFMTDHEVTVGVEFGTLLVKLE